MFVRNYPVDFADQRSPANENLAGGGLVEAVRRLVPLIGAHAAESDANAHFPAHDVRLLANIGLLRAFAAAENGGARFADRPSYVDCLFDCLRLIGRASLSLGRIFEGHVNAIALIERWGSQDANLRLSKALEAGELFGVWNTEPPPGVRLAGRPGAWWLWGGKSYATGAGHLDWAIVTARLPDGQKQMLLLPVGEQPERADSGVWRTRGMRATVSGAFDFSGIKVDGDAFLGSPGDYEREPMFTGGAWRFTAVQSGAIQRLVALHRDHLRRTGGDADPIQRARFGRAVVAARTAFQWVKEAARRVELDEGAESAPFVLMTRGVVEEAGLAVIEAVQRAVGTQSFFTDSPIDLVMRDLALYLRQAAPDNALDRAAAAWLETDCWVDDAWW